MSSWDALRSRLIFQSGIGFLYRQLFMHPPPIAAHVKLSGQTAIITGSNTGLGLEAARQLLRLNLSRLILAVRSPAKGNLAADALRKQFPTPDTIIEVWTLDMENPASVTAFATKCQTSLDKIDIVLLNAGVQNRDYVVSVQTGKEQTYQVNFLSTILLAVLILPILVSKGSSAVAGRPPRLTIVTSTTAYFAHFNDKKAILTQFDEEYDPKKWYAREKLLQMVLVRRLAELVSSEDVVINTVCPGLVGDTEIWRSLNENAFLRALFKVYFVLFGRSLVEGASTYVHATVVAGRESHGAFLSEWGVRP
ncbi:short-chain dehydrogenase reductase family [Pyrenophora seminiperda CCB06]|uniref:Short-chain dehydrogenase reductase family n=1 Tax=Pyrenophora seminiperda CCB06 TaxID=1302712 RepID=A0A3M7M865_9PLEO|nr:short-chain dehydrogenase reductase family [Pyrenophora seminiperda CCB06]